MQQTVCHSALCIVVSFQGNFKILFAHALDQSCPPIRSNSHACSNPIALDFKIAARRCLAHPAAIGAR